MLVDSMKLAYEAYQSCRHLGAQTGPLLDLLARTLAEVERSGTLVVDVQDARLDAVDPRYREAAGCDPGADPAPVELSAAELGRLWSRGSGEAAQSLGYALHALPDLVRSSERFKPELFVFCLRIAAFQWPSLSPGMQEALCDAAGLTRDGVDALLGQEGFAIDMFGVAEGTAPGLTRRAAPSMLGPPMLLRVPLGISDFRKLREQEAEYIDKSHLLIELLDRAAEVEACWADLRQKIRALFSEHRGLLAGDSLSAHERKDYEAVLDGTAEDALYRRALGDLSKYLHRQTNERAIILIDEYDEPIHAGFVHGYATEVLDFFSGLNNLAVYTLLDTPFNTCFGFTEPEVQGLLDKAELSSRLDAARAWYNGYVFGGKVIYNPWSVLSFIDHGGQPQAYWLNTSSNDLIKASLEKHGPRLQPALEALLAGGGFEVILDQNVVLDRVDQSDATLWSLLVFSGYLKAEERIHGPAELASHYLSIPNRKVRLVYTSTFQEWFEARLRGHGGDLRRLLAALLAGDAELLERQLGAFVKNVLSYHDLSADEPERIYQAFLLGLFTTLEPGHRVRSNRESGKGRPDVLILPAKPQSPGAVLELKVARGNKTLDQALEEGAEQIRDKEYAAELHAAGADPVHLLVIAFDGKEVRVQRAEA